MNTVWKGSPADFGKDLAFGRNRDELQKLAPGHGVRGPSVELKLECRFRFSRGL